MGVFESRRSMQEFESRLSLECVKAHWFYGDYSLMIHRNKQQKIIKKQLMFESHSDVSNFIVAYGKIEKVPFNLIYPLAVFNNSYYPSCAPLNEVLVYFTDEPISLDYMVKKQGSLSETKAWFVLNQLSRSLEILNQGHKSHWGISPQTVFQNKNGNWLIYDSYFLHGADYQNCLLRKLRSKTMTSPAIQRQIEKAIGVNSEQGKDEDMYCLGYTFVFALTGYRYDALSKLEAGERYEKAMQLLRETRVSLELAKLVAKLIDNTVEVRLTLAKLRKSLREKQTEIIFNDNLQSNSYRKRFQTDIQKSKRAKNIQLGSPSPTINRSRNLEYQLPRQISTFALDNRPTKQSIKMSSMLSPTAKKIDMNSPRRINNTTESPDFMEGSKNPIKICVQSSGNMVIQKMTLQSRQIQPQGMIWQKQYKRNKK